MAFFCRRHTRKALPGMAKVCTRNLRIVSLSSIIFAGHTVQVTTDANESPSMTACTRMSADINMDQGDRSRGRLLASRGASDVARGAGAYPSVPVQRMLAPIQQRPQPVARVRRLKKRPSQTGKTALPSRPREFAGASARQASAVVLVFQLEMVAFRMPLGGAHSSDWGRNGLEPACQDVSD
jgi:hypothetical protein